MAMELSNHHFLKLLGKLGGDLIENAFDQSESEGAKNFQQTRPFRWYERYLERVLKTAGELVTTCEQVEHSLAFMSNFRSTPGLKEKNITRLDHIQYHIENHLIRMISAGDRALIVTSIVFRLGIKPEDCNHHVILNNEYVEGTEVEEKLKKMASVIQPFRKERNEVVHKNTYSDEDMQTLETVYFLEKRGESPAPYYWTKRETDEFVSERKQEMREANDDLFDAVSGLFTSLEEVFKKRYPSEKITA